jgi:acyl-CoA synthetase (AMP-forming)/AMP-acid ligase II
MSQSSNEPSDPALPRSPGEGRLAASLPLLPLLLPAHGRPIALRQRQVVSVEEFRRHVARIAAQLPVAGTMINLCEDRYSFLAAYAAAARAGHTVLLPPSRAEQVVAEVQGANPGSYRCDDAAIESALLDARCDSVLLQLADAAIPAGHTIMIGHTSGSTGMPKRYPKAWRSVSASTARNANAIRALLGAAPGQVPWILATVPPQHMYGMELSVLLPLIGGMAVHADRPLFPADIASALQELPRPRVLVSTPVHLRAIVESNQEFPAVSLIVSATAPLDQSLAAAVERKLGGPLLELFGSTETCVFAARRTALDHLWQLYDDVRLEPHSDGTIVAAPWLAEPLLLQDIVELRGARGFVVRGRNSDMIEVAGKRASLRDLTRRLLALEGVEDAVVFQPDGDSAGAIRRVAALVVAPGLSTRAILDRLAASVDPAFLPRPLRIVDSLPRNDVGKLPREALLQALRRR